MKVCHELFECNGAGCSFKGRFPDEIPSYRLCCIRNHAIWIAAPERVFEEWGRLQDCAMPSHEVKK